MKIAVITALAGNKEKLYCPKHVFPGVDYFAFVDSPQSTGIWKQKPLLHFSNDIKFSNRRNAKIFKIMPHLFVPDYDYYFWVDISHCVMINPFEIISKYFDNTNNEIAVFKHTQRNCAYDEAKVINELGYDHKVNVDAQVTYYNEQQFPKNYGLYEMSAFIRKNTQKTQTLNQMWWSMIEKYSSRDQISFPFCLWKTGITPLILPGYSNGFNKDGKIGNNEIMPQVIEHVSSGPG